MSIFDKFYTMTLRLSLTNVEAVDVVGERADRVVLRTARHPLPTGRAAQAQGASA
jgi:hypothetical protein